MTTDSYIRTQYLPGPDFWFLSEFFVSRVFEVGIK